MWDLIFILATVAFFAISLAYVEGCQRLWALGNWSWGLPARYSWPRISYTHCYAPSDS